MPSSTTAAFLTSLPLFGSILGPWDQTLAPSICEGQKLRCTQRRPRRSLRLPCACTGPIPGPSKSPSSDNLSCSPLSSLTLGTWFKLICGASSHDAPSIRNLSAIYTAVGADCIDVACDYAIVRAAREGIAAGLAHRRSPYPPLLMVSVNAASDPHFRKAEFVPTACPPACPRPCEAVCPAMAIDLTGVIIDRCYGCGRCVPVCPPEIIETVDHVHDASFVANMLEQVDAVEIHTGPGQETKFRTLWMEIEHVASRLKVVAVSLPDLGGDEALAAGLKTMWDVMNTGTVFGGIKPRLIWQADGRPMSGDIGRGTAKAAVKLGRRMRDILNKIEVPGEVQLAGGTNDSTVPLMERDRLRRIPGVGLRESAAGIAVGGYARKIVHEALQNFEGPDGELNDVAFQSASAVAQKLVTGIKALQHEDCETLPFRA